MKTKSVDLILSSLGFDVSGKDDRSPLLRTGTWYYFWPLSHVALREKLAGKV